MSYIPLAVGDQESPEQGNEKLLACQRILTMEAIELFELWHKRNEIIHGSNEQEHTELKLDRFKCTLEAIHHLKDSLQTVDRQYMFQNLQERGIQDGQKEAIQGVKPITSHFKKQTSISRSYLPPRFTSCYDGLNMMLNKGIGNTTGLAKLCPGPTAWPSPLGPTY
eukprot:1130221-Ditylum_brightwellii.AAC.1